MRFFHPVTGSEVSASNLESYDELDGLFIRRHDYRPNSWEKFKLSHEDFEVDRTYGIEIEINRGRGDYATDYTFNETLLEICKVMNKEAKHIHLMYDGSLRNGFEIVTAPMTIGYFKEKFDAEEINNLFRKLGLFASYDCGLHIHAGVLSKNFNDIIGYRDELLRLFNITLPLWTSIGNRTIGYQGTRYASTSHFTRTGSKQLKYLVRTHDALLRTGTSKVQFDVADGDMFLNFESSNRYQALNLSNEKTVEFRLFKGTHNWNVITEYLEFVHTFMTYYENNDTRQIKSLHDYVEETDSHDHLDKIVRDARRYTYLYNKGLAGLTPYNELDLSLYERPTNHISVGDYIMNKSDWEDYIRNLEILNNVRRIAQNTGQASYEIPEYGEINIDFEDFIFGTLREVISVGETQIASVSISRGSSTVRKQNRNRLENYVVLHGIPRDQFSFMGCEQVELLKSK